MSEKVNNITEGSISRGILGLAIPMMTGFLMHNVFNIVDMYFVGMLGRVPLAAVSLGGIFIGIIYTFALGISTGTTAIVSRYEGMGDREGARRIGKQAIYLGIIIYLILVTTANAATKPILHILGVEGEVFRLAVEYIRIILTGSFAIFVPMAISAYLRGCGDAVTPMRGMILGSTANVILDPIFIFGFLFIPGMGVAGSALGTVLARFIAMLYFIYHISRKTGDFHISILPIEIDFGEMWRIIRIGAFGSLQSILRTMSEIIMMRLIVAYGAAAIAAYGVGLRLRLIVLLPILGLGTAASTMVGQNMGAGKIKRAEKSGWITAGFSIIVMLAAGVILSIFAEGIMGIFTQHPNVIKDGALFIRYFSASFIFIGLSISMEKALGGSGDTISPMFITLIGLYLFRIPLAIQLQKYFGMEGVWMGIAFSSIVTGTIFTIWFWIGRWKKKKV